MYPDQVAIINNFREKFNTTQYGITKFIRNNRIMEAPEERMCTNGLHKIRLGMILYIFNGKPYNLKNFYCSDMKCFLESIDKNSINTVKEILQTKEKSLMSKLEKDNEDNFNEIK